MTAIAFLADAGRLAMFAMSGRANVAIQLGMAKIARLQPDIAFK
jgi:hypothetical protein